MSRKILISPGYGAGWTTWNSGYVAPTMLVWKPIIDAIESGEQMHPEHPAVKELEEYCLEEFGEDYVCVLGADNLVVHTVHGKVFIFEHDGHESFITRDEDDGWM